MRDVFGRARAIVNERVWDADLQDAPWPRRAAAGAARIGWAVIRDLRDGQLTLRAMSLVYTTLLSLVPLLALSFSVLKGFGVHNAIEPFLLSVLSDPFGSEAGEIVGNIIGFVDKMRVGVLGFVGLLLLVYTVVSLVQKIEGAFNYIWRIVNARSFTQAFSVYLAVILVGPVLMFAAVGFTASIMSNTVVQGLLAIEPFGMAAYTLGRILPYVLVCGAFTFIYAFIPNTRVRFVSALIGGVFAGVAWQLVGRLFAAFVVGSVKYEAIYSGFAILIMFMIWLYVSWLILLLGAQIAFYHQHPHLTGRRRSAAVAGSAAAERAGMTIMYLIGRSHLAGAAPWTSEALVEHLGLHADVTKQLLERLTARRLIIATAADPPGLVPGRALESIALKDVLDAVRGAAPDGMRAPPPVEACAGAVDAAVAHALADRTLRDLLEEQDGADAAATPTAG